MRPLVRLALAAAFPLAACSSNTAAPHGDPASAVAEAVAGQGVRFTNPSSATVYYTALERDFAARALFAPCTDPAICPSVGPGRQTIIPYSLIGGYEAGKREVIVYYWRLEPAEGGHVARDMRSAVVQVGP